MVVKNSSLSRSRLIVTEPSSIITRHPGFLIMASRNFSSDFVTHACFTVLLTCQLCSCAQRSSTRDGVWCVVHIARLRWIAKVVFPQSDSPAIPIRFLPCVLFWSLIQSLRFRGSGIDVENFRKCGLNVRHGDLLPAKRGCFLEHTALSIPFDHFGNGSVFLDGEFSKCEEIGCSREYRVLKIYRRFVCPVHQVATMQNGNGDRDSPGV